MPALNAASRNHYSFVMYPAFLAVTEGKTLVRILISATMLVAAACAAADPALPPTSAVTRAYPRLVNYYHIGWPQNQGISQKEERLAQWNILILSPDIVEEENISLAKIRQTNPDIKILAWVPFGQEPDGPIAQAFPSPGPGDWYCRDTSGEYLVPAWGGHMMNPARLNYAWPEHAAAFIKTHYIDTGDYDGVMFDMLCEYEPFWLSLLGADVNEDGLYDAADHTAWQMGCRRVLERLRALCPGVVITGNGGVPWSPYCPYFENANGDMHENAFGNEFLEQDWNYVWSGYQACMAAPNPLSLPRCHFLATDLRYNRSLEEAQALTELTPDDLRRMRLGLGTTLLDGGYFSFDRGDCLHGQLWWFDWYDANLGEPLGAMTEDATAPGVFSRAFQYGVVIVNSTATDYVAELPGAAWDMTAGVSAETIVVPRGDARLLVHGWAGFALQPQDARAYAGESHTFEIEAESTGTLACQWRCDRGETGPASDTWTIPLLSDSSQGQYWCEVLHNGTRFLSARATLTVKEHLHAAIQPAPMAYTLGDAFTLAAETSGGYEPLQYVWEKDGVPIPGATGAVYTCARATLHHAGVYTVHIRDDNTDAASASIAIQIVPGLPIKTPAATAAIVLLLALSRLPHPRRKPRTVPSE